MIANVRPQPTAIVHPWTVSVAGGVAALSASGDMHFTWLQPASVT